MTTAEVAELFGIQPQSVRAALGRYGINETRGWSRDDVLSLSAERRNTIRSTYRIAGASMGIQVQLTDGISTVRHHPTATGWVGVFSAGKPTGGLQLNDATDALVAEYAPGAWSCVEVTTEDSDAS